MAEIEYGSTRKAPGDSFAAWVDAGLEDEDVAPGDPLESDEAQKEHKRLLEWFYFERDRQSANRLEMALDADVYDGLQWDEEDAAILRERGQLPLVYNEIKPMIDWLIGTERRTRVDWRVLPRSEDDVPLADTKTKVLKYVSDINRVPFARSRAFTDAVKVGVGWVDDGARDDPTQDVLYSKYEDWRNVLWDSSSYELDLSDARYLFRWRWVDEDVALAMFPGQENKIREAAEDSLSFKFDEDELDTWGGMTDNLGNKGGYQLTGIGGTGFAVDVKRRRIKLIEAQYRKPCVCRVVADGPLKGNFLRPGEGDAAEIIDKVMMRVHFAVFTEKQLLALGPSTYRHNRFTLTPIWCYRRSRDRLPYGVVRTVRDIQLDLNKRASKALFMLNTNQVIADEGAVDDWKQLADEVSRPDGVIIKRQGKELVIRRDTDAATGQVQMMTLDAQSIQKVSGVNNENLGRQTNAVSGAAIQARQNQGAVSTTELFDNLRFAVQVQGEKQLAMTEQFYSEAKVIRLTGAKGALEWVRINQPEIQPDGSIRYINDVTAAAADFVVSEADYAGTLRQVMFDSLNQIVQKMPPEVGLRLFTIAMEFSDLPNKDEIAEAIRRVTGDRDPNKPMTPEEAMQAEQQMQAQAEAMQMQREQAMLAMEEQRAKIAKLQAEAAALMQQDGDEGGMPGEIEAAIAQVRADAADQIDALSQELRKAQGELANRTMQIARDADIKLETARIDADTKIRVAEIQAASDKAIEQLQRQLSEIAKNREVARHETKQPAVPAPAPAPAPAAPTTINISVDAKTGEVKKSVKIERDAEGNMTGAKIVEDDGETNL